jgi:hypothetical protein
MGFFNWLFAKPALRSDASPHSGVHTSLADATRPFFPAKPGAKSASPLAAPAAAGNSSERMEQRRNERNTRRELLFQVVRESMVRIGVLSSAFKFKVLALDQRGHTFLVMIDLSAEFAGETDKLTEIENLIAQSAKTRYDLTVQAVYWRFYDSVSGIAGRPNAASAPTPLFGVQSSRPAPLSAQPFPSVPPVASPAVATAAVASAKPAFSRPAPLTTAPQEIDPLEHDEVEAFKRALASGSQPGMAIPLGGNSAALAAAVRPAPAKPAAANPVPVKPAVAKAAPAASLAAIATAKAAAAAAAVHNKLLLTGYEDTEMPDPDAPELSGTQYGELR